MKYNGLNKSTTNDEIVITDQWVYIRKNIKDVSFFDNANNKIELYEFDEYQYSKDEYMQHLYAENKELKETLDIILGVTESE